MNSKENQFDKIIKSRMENYEVLPEEDFWDNIESTMVRKKYISYIRIILIISTAIIIAFFAYRKYASSKPAVTGEPEKTTKASPSVSGDGAHASNDGSSQQYKSPSSTIESNTQGGGNYLSKQQIINRSNIADSAANTMTGLPDINENIFTTSAAVDTVTTQVPVAEKSAPKKIVKQPVYIIKQDTIYKVDTLKTKKKKRT